MQHHHRGFTQVVKHGGSLFKKQGQVVFNACRRNTIAHVFVNAAACRVTFQQFTPLAAKQGAGAFIHRKFAAW